MQIFGNSFHLLLIAKARDKVAFPLYSHYTLSYAFTCFIVRIGFHSFTYIASPSAHKAEGQDTTE